MGVAAVMPLSHVVYLVPCDAHSAWVHGGKTCAATAMIALLVMADEALAVAEGVAGLGVAVGDAVGTAAGVGVDVGDETGDSRIFGVIVGFDEPQPTNVTVMLART